MALDSFSPFQNRYIDVGAGGPTPFTFTVTSNASWVKLTPAKGSISPKSPEQRVFISVADWSQLAGGANTASLTFTATASKEPASAVTVMFTATKVAPPADFKGE